MIKKIIFPLIASLFLLVSCSTKNNEVIEEKKQTKLSTSYKENNLVEKKVAFLGKSYSNNKYTYLGNLLFFPNPNNNEVLSVADISDSTYSIQDNSIIDRFNYNTNSITSDVSNIYFSSISNNRGLFKLDYQKKEITNISTDTALEMLYYEDKLYYINSNDNNIYTYSIKDKSTRLLSDFRASNLLINNNSIFYKNLSDSSKLYCLTTDGITNLKIIDYPVDSFAIHNDELLFSNSKDNNYLYSLNPSNSEIKKLLDISVSNLKENNNTIYFINNEDPKALYKLTTNNETNKFEATEVFPYFTNDYYPSEKGLFIEAAHSLDNITIIPYN